MIRVFLVAALAALAAPVGATQDQWPALFDVTGVAADDVLNIRTDPDATSDIIATLAPDATRVEVIRPNERESWGMVNAGERTGWVSLAFLQRRAGQWLGAHPRITSCFGTEPFWSLDLQNENALAWRTPEIEIAGGRIEARLASGNRRDRHGLSARFSFGKEATEISAITALQVCTDGMSDRAYGISVDVLMTGVEGTALYSGCCTLAP